MRKEEGQSRHILTALPRFAKLQAELLPYFLRDREYRVRLKRKPTSPARKRLRLIMPKTPQPPADGPNESSGLSASPLAGSVLASPLAGAPPPWLLDVCPLPPMTSL